MRTLQNRGTDIRYFVHDLEEWRIPTLEEVDMALKDCFAEVFAAERGCGAYSFP